MSIILALIRKGWLDVRWMLAMIAGTCFGLCWLFVFLVGRGEHRGRIPPAVPTIVAEMFMWESVPIFLILIAVWSIARGSAAVAGEIERGTMDMVLSRPVNRTVFLAIQVLVGSLGLLLIVGSMVAGNMVAARYNTLRTPPSFLMLAKPAFNLAAYGWSIYGYTFLLSTLDLVRWRPVMIGAVATLACFIAHAITRFPNFDDDWKWIDHLSIFRACNLSEVVTTGETFAFNVGILGLIGAIGVACGFVAFATRDLPAGS